MINYKHLQYFWVVAKEGSISKASERLHLTPQTISGQLTVLEANLGEALFVRVGRNLEITETGRKVMSYANEIFSLGEELEEMMRNLPASRPKLFNVGVADVVPKSIASRLIMPALKLAEPIRINCREGPSSSLLSELSMHKLDLVIADNPIPSNVKIRGFNHPLGDCGTAFFATKKISEELKVNNETGFPYSLNKAPLLLPGEMTTVRRHLMRWLDDMHIHPSIVGEFDDSALMKSFGQMGAGIFIAPAAIADEVKKQYGVVLIGVTEDVRAKFYAISVERKISHPAVVAITETAREWLYRE